MQPGGNAKDAVSDGHLQYDVQPQRDRGRERKIQKRNEEQRVRASLTKEGQEWDKDILSFCPEGEGAKGAAISFSALAKKP